jgi:hypothetical protein
MQKNCKKTYFLLAACQPLTKKAAVSQWYGPADPDPHHNVTVYHTAFSNTKLRRSGVDVSPVYVSLGNC